MAVVAKKSLKKAYYNLHRGVLEGAEVSLSYPMTTVTVYRLTLEATEPADSNRPRRSSRTRTAVIFNS